MRGRACLLAAIATAMVAVVAVAAWSGGVAAPAPRLADQRANAMPVDVELVIAVDVSNSMDPEEQELQREGYVAALTSKEFLSALRAGAYGKVALTYVEWAGLFDQTILLPWRLIDGAQSADAVAREIARAPYRRAPRTSIYGALQFARPLFDASGYRGQRQVIDVSGDGVNNQGPPVTRMRDEVLAAGITVNGLPIMLQRQGFGMWGTAFANLDIYYEDCVIGGPGSFVISIRERDQFKEATRTKLVMEVAGVTPVPRPMPTQSKRPRVFCS
ncbi:MAG: DUF1194 domain-containing protein [Hyphomicrobiales bacterium]|nr:DUF1194 domain-containing protein [Hyphomicrobiales bacterium]